MRVAFVHDWLVSYRGGEKVLEALLSLYPEAPVFTLFYDAKAMPATINQRRIIYPKWLAPCRRLRKALLPILPTVAESFDLTGYDLIISTSSCVAKGVIPPPGAKHICYLHSPMRYIWDQQQEYIDAMKWLPGAGLAIKLISPYLRRWDVKSAARVDRFIVNSHFVGERVRDYYHRDSTVIHPPIDVERFSKTGAPAPGKAGGYFLAAGAFVPYKRLDLAITACEELGKKLIVAGAGPLAARLQRLANGNTAITLAPDDEHWVKLLQGADALIFPGVEDFGMVPIEAMASGTPVIAFRRGGALDYVQPGETGEFFDAQEKNALIKVLTTYDPGRYDREKLLHFADRFRPEHFLMRMREEIAALMHNQRTN